MPKVRPETKYKRKFRENYPFWSESYEPSMGSGTGYPDIQVLSPQKVLLPIELKTCRMKEGRLFPTEVRPDQVVWHHNFTRFGGKSILAMGWQVKIGEDKWHTFAVPSSEVGRWRDGYDPDECFYVEFSVGDGLVKLVEHFLLEEQLQPLARAMGRVI